VGKQQYSGQSETDYLASAWTVLKELEDSAGGATRVVLRPSNRRRVWVVRTELCDVADSRLVAVRRVHGVEWPSARRSSFAADLFTAAIDLDRLGDSPIEALAAGRA